MKTLASFAIVPVFVLLVAATVLTPLAQAQQPNDDRAKDAREGLIVNEPAAFQGYTLLAPMNSTSTYLIDMEGRIVNEWKSDYTPALSAYLLENGHLLRPGAERGYGPSGAGAGGRIQEFTWEGKLVWDYSFGDSKLRPHHDICRLPSGNVLVIASDPKTEEEAVAAGRWPESVSVQFMPDCILEVKPTGPTTGEIVWRWHAWDHLIQDCDDSKPNFGNVTAHPELIDVNFGSGMMDRMMQDPEQLERLRSLGYVGGGDDEEEEENDDRRGDHRGGPGGGPGGPGGDWMHVNYVVYNPKLDQIMISVHEFSEAWIIDHSTTTAEAASHKGGRSGRGGDLLYRWGNPQAYRAGSGDDQRLFAQHDAHWIEEGLPGAGHMLVFNNGGGRRDGVYSSVDEIKMPLSASGTYDKKPTAPFEPDRATWSYASRDRSDFFSMLISSAQRLPNGNTFICSGNQARLFEVTPKGEIVWQYQHPGGGFGGPGGPGGFGALPRPGEVVPEFLQHFLGVSDSQRQSIQKLQADVDQKLAKLLTDEQRKKLEQPAQFPPGGMGRPDQRRDRGQVDRGQPRGARPNVFRPARVGTVLPEPVIETLALSDAQRKNLAQIQQRVDDQLGKIWTEQQKTQLKEMEEALARMPGAGSPPGMGPRGGVRPPGGNGPDGDQRRDGRRGRGGTGGGPGVPGGGPGGGPGGIFCSYRYAPDYPGLVDRELKPGKKLAEVAATPQPDRQKPRDGGR